MRSSLLPLCLALLAGIAGCAWSCNFDRGDRSHLPPPPEQIGAPAIADSAGGVAGPAGEARFIFDEKCVSCHGKEGKGDGPALTFYKLQHKPADYTNRDWHKYMSDAEMENIIVYGGGAVGKSGDMPGFPELQGRSDVVRELVRIVRSFAK